MKTEANDSIILSKETMNDDGSITLELEMSQSDLDLLEDMAKEQNISIDELVSKILWEWKKDKEWQENIKTS